MLSGLSLATTTLKIAQFYNKNQINLDEAAQRIASGKRAQRPADDSTNYFRSRDIAGDNRIRNSMRQEVQAGIGMLNVAVTSGTMIFENLNRMRDIVREYYKPETTADMQLGMAAEFNSLKTETSTLINNTQYEGKNLISSGTLKTIQLDPNDMSNTYTISFSASMIADPSGLDITTGLATAEADVNAQIIRAGSYLGNASASLQGLMAQDRMMENTVTKTEEFRSYIQDTDEAQEITRVMNYSLRSQATTAMLGQANMARSSVLMLLGIG